MDLTNPFAAPTEQARELLAAYAAAIDALEPDEAGDRPPAERIADFGGLEERELAELHGELLAGGWVDFVFGGRGVTASYVVTQAGRAFVGDEEPERRAAA